MIKWIEGLSPWKFPAWFVWLLAFSGAMLLVFSAGIIVLKLQVNARTSELSKRNEELQEGGTWGEKIHDENKKVTRGNKLKGKTENKKHKMMTRRNEMSG